MLRITRITPGPGYEYLTGQVANGRHDFRPTGPGSPTAYYADAQARGEAPGWWAGSGARVLGVSGEVTQPQMRLLVAEGRHPITGAKLGRPWRRYKPATETQRQEDLTKALAGLPHDATPEQKQRAWQQTMAAPARHADAAFDLTVSPVKSVSLLWAFADDPTRQTVLAAHHAGIRAAIAELEQHAAFTRRGTNGIRQVDTHGLAVMVFDHRMSRDRDPQLHSHIVLSAKVLSNEPDTEDAWLSLDSSALYHASGIARIAYERALEWHLIRHLGIRFATRPGTDIREIAGIPTRSIDAYSKRRAAIETEMDQRITGPDGTREHIPTDRWRRRADDATLRTRQPKHGTESTTEAIARWHAEDRAAGLNTAGQIRTLLTDRTAHEAINTLAAQALATARRTSNDPHSITEDDVRRAATTLIQPHEPDRIEAVIDAAVRAEPSLAVERALRHLSEQRAVFTLNHLELAIGRVLDIDPSTPNAATDWARVQHLADNAIRTGQAGLRVLTPPSPVTWGPSLRRASDGQSVYTRHRDLTLTTLQVTAAEQQVLDYALTATTHPAPAAAIDHIAAALSLDTEKHAALRFLTADHRPIVGLYGPAGSGKTFLQRAVAQLAARSGIPVLGLTVSQNAADLLAAATGGMRCENIAMWLHAQHHPPRDTTSADWSFRPSQWVIIDEASQVSTLDLARLVTLLRPVAGKLLLVGDPLQTTAIGPGGLFPYLHSLGRTTELTRTHRFQQPWEGPASLRLRTGDPAALTDYDTHGRLHGGTRPELTHRMLTVWAADTLQGRHSVLLAETEADAAGLAAQARQRLAAAGRVDTTRTVPLRDGTRCGAGDTIVTRHNDRTLRAGTGFVANRDQWHVTTVHPTGALQVVHTRTGDTTTLDPAYVAAHVHLAYAQTVESAQGQTVDTCHALIDSTTTRPRLYVMLTRGAHTNHAYVITGRHPTDGPTPPPTTAVATLAHILRTPTTDHSATETEHTLWSNADALHHWAPIYDDLSATATRHHHLALIRRLTDDTTAERLAADPALPRLSAALTRAEHAGYHPDHLLTAVTTRRELATADSVALVLTCRIEHLLAATSPDPALTNHPPAGPRSFAARIPATDNPDLADALHQVAAVCDHRIRALTDTAADNPPPWAQGLGPVPADPTERLRWRRRAAAVAAYRDRYQITGPDPIGLEPSPTDPQRWHAWHHARAALRTATLAGHAAHASTTWLLAAVACQHACEAAAPPYVAGQLRAAHLALAAVQYRAHHLALHLAAPSADTTAPQLRASLAALITELQGQAARVDHLEADHARWTRWFDGTRDERLTGTVAALELTRRTAGNPGSRDRRIHELLDQLAAFTATQTRQTPAPSRGEHNGRPARVRQPLSHRNREPADEEYTAEAQTPDYADTDPGIDLD
jgi:conjugative relaxase-like TrwC/TraI family protein